jgi:2-polyprenyl-3-methyl-5-hydroxy-6-metoxy-1,4-benzoquinol methylase
LWISRNGTAVILSCVLPVFPKVLLLTVDTKGAATMDYSIQEFYQHLAPDYHFIFKDWAASVRRQGDVLDKLIRAERERADTVLDCACGIGTQAIGLALHGYNVRATDLSPAAVRRARSEARNFGVKIFFGNADFRDLARAVDGTFDVVLACDNSIAHVLSDGDLTLATASMREARARRPADPEHP